MNLMMRMERGLVHAWTSTGRIFVFVGACLFVATGFAEELISITATPRYPWNGKVDLKFTIDGTSGTKYDTSFTAKDVAGGTNLTMKTLVKSDGTAVSAVGAPLLPGTYNWVWDTTADLGEGVVLEKMVVEGEVMAPVYYVKFNANGGTGTMADEEFQVGVAKALTANAFTRAGYVFLGWATSTSGSAKYSDKQDVTDLTDKGDTLNLYAVWKLSGVQLWDNGPYWAECNVGAANPEDFGYCFWWGDTVGYKHTGSKWDAADGSKTGFSFEEKNCPTYDKTTAQLRSAGYIDFTGNLVAAHDAATVHWGAPWRMMTNAELQRLVDTSYCTRTWVTSYNGKSVQGYIVKGAKDPYKSNEVFFPAAGIGFESAYSLPGLIGEYWSSTPNSGDSNRACILDFYYLTLGCENFLRFEGLSVRPVRDVAK